MSSPTTTEPGATVSATNPSTGFNRTAAAQRLGLTLRQIRYRIARLGIQLQDAEGDEGPTPAGPDTGRNEDTHAAAR